MKIIYLIENIVNNKKYIGQTKDLHKRMKYHSKDKDRGRFQSPLYEEVNSYGEEYFIVTEIETVSKDIADDRERFWIKHYNTMSPNGYNLTSGGENGKEYATVTKSRIGEKTKERWRDPEIAMRMKEGLRKTGLSQKGKIKTPRETRVCELCRKEFVEMVTSPKIYCTRQCSGQVAMTRATETYVEKRANIHIGIKEDIEDWAIENKQLITDAKFNQIKPTLEPILEIVEEKYDVKDMRVISKAIVNTESRKDLLKHLKEIVKD